MVTEARRIVYQGRRARQGVISRVDEEADDGGVGLGFGGVRGSW